MNAADDTRLYRMSPLEIARGYVVDLERHRPRPLVDGPLPSPRVALEECMLEALQQQPCVVAFSGGRDSSALLALAMALARREGLPEPVALTRRFPGFKDTLEDEWQELVARHVGVSDWERVDLDDEAMDLLGPVARPRLERYGVLWPPLLHQDAPAVARARGGALVDGEGGDQILGLDLHRIAPVVLARGFKSRRSLRHLASAGAALAPGGLQRRIQRHRLRDLGATWLRPKAARELVRDLAVEHTNRPVRWDASLRVFLQHRGRQGGLRNGEHFAEQLNVTYHHPFLRPRFIEAMAREGGRMGLGTRTALMRRLFGDLLPDPVIERRTKAAFNKVVHGRVSRRFVEHWDGSGVDNDLVDADALLREWRSPSPSARTFALLQMAWLHQRDGDSALGLDRPSGDR